MKEVVDVRFRGSERGVPNKHCTFDGHEAWTELAGEEVGDFNANKSAATLITNHVLRLLQVYLGYNLLGQECCITKVTLTELYFIWKAYRHETMNLGFWTAYQIHQISRNRTRHYSMCHFLGAFLARNMNLITPHSVGKWEVVPSPTLFNLEFLIVKLIVRMREGNPEVIYSGDSKPRMQSSLMQEQVEGKEGDQDKEKSEDPEPLDLKTVENHVGWLLNEQLAQRDQIDKLQCLVQQLIRILKENNIDIPTSSKSATEDPQTPSSSTKKARKKQQKKREATPVLEEEEEEEEEEEPDRPTPSPTQEGTKVAEPENEEEVEADMPEEEEAEAQMPENDEEVEAEMPKEEEVEAEVPDNEHEAEMPKEDEEEAEVPKQKEEESEQEAEAEAFSEEEKEADQEDPPQ